MRKILDGLGNDEKISSFTGKVKPFSIMVLLATVVGVLVEMPVVLSLVAIA